MQLVVMMRVMRVMMVVVSRAIRWVDVDALAGATFASLSDTRTQGHKDTRTSSSAAYSNYAVPVSESAPPNS
jgi:hypothetical protein